MSKLIKCALSEAKNWCSLVPSPCWPQFLARTYPHHCSEAVDLFDVFPCLHHLVDFDHVMVVVAERLWVVVVLLEEGAVLWSEVEG